MGVSVAKRLQSTRGIGWGRMFNAGDRQQVDGQDTCHPTETFRVLGLIGDPNRGGAKADSAKGRAARSRTAHDYAREVRAERCIVRSAQVSAVPGVPSYAPRPC